MKKFMKKIVDETVRLCKNEILKAISRLFSQLKYLLSIIIYIYVSCRPTV